ncbi:MAG: sigma-70 family RNA polymerase sigma factor [Cytophagaceae bacterium]|jgi:RNA polymerase sigma-70 factor (ECF subfamily)|nr:sigma-70 family RNA polymerase sigma factor [Cytophagaceae bacterium]
MSTSEFQNLVLKETSLLKSFAMKLTMNREDAKDLLQDTLLKALRYREKFADSTNLKAWLCVIMKNTFINNYRRQTKANKFLTVVEDVRTVRPERRFHNNNVESEMFQAEIMKSINKLKDEFRIPFERYRAGFQYQEIADELEIPLGTVKSRIFLARQEIMKNLKMYQN